MSAASFVNYKSIYGRFLIVIGIVFTAIFILGFIADIDNSIYYTLLGGIIILGGYGMLKGHYAIYDEQSISTFNFGFSKRTTYEFKDKSEIQVKNNLLYCNGKKLKMNSWFISKSDWSRMLKFYSDSDDTLLSELKDDSSLL
jgi:hypothetical protein